ncbi:hypothetical protein AWB74_04515 [Caballeronia arvi]|uniref:Uncharacterized protein n=1 Tax=Caballeronia arvi TaxID=1777135 RepID=A0A158JXR2_9BURK|nr:DUF6072 family protein [Caballeronia arvi]SAL73608.1 hypothetical protein AWB74_04515 [Caballeronia arvi]
MKDNLAVASTPQTETVESRQGTVVSSRSPVTNGVKLVGEAFVPGASLLMDGKVVNGAAHVAAGIGIKMLFGPAGLLLAAADSYSKSVTDKYLWDHVGDLVSKAKDTREARKTRKAESPIVTTDAE